MNGYEQYKRMWRASGKLVVLSFLVSVAVFLALCSGCGDRSDEKRLIGSPLSKDEAGLYANSVSRATGWVMLPVQGQSMEPYFSGNAYVALTPAWNEIEEGQAIASSDGSRTVLHQAIRKEGQGWVTRGVNNPEEDSGVVTKEGYLGTYVGRIHFNPNKGE